MKKVGKDPVNAVVAGGEAVAKAIAKAYAATIVEVSKCYMEAPEVGVSMEGVETNSCYLFS